MRAHGLRVYGDRGETMIRPVQATDELVEALIALGSRRAEAEAAAEIGREGSSEIGDQLKIALAHLRK